MFVSFSLENIDFLPTQSGGMEIFYERIEIRGTSGKYG